MNMYNMVNGMNASFAVIVSCILGFRLDEKIPRFRDVFGNADDCPYQKDEYDFIIYTRMGGGNYQCWNEEDDDDYNEDTCDCPYHELLKIEKEPWYVGAYDDDFDCTYRNLVCRFTPEQKKIFEEVKTKGFSVIEKQAKELFPKLFERKDV